MLCFFRRKNTLFIFAEIVSRKIVSQHPFVARGVGCVDVQLLELHQHFVAVVVGTVSECKDTKLLKAIQNASDDGHLPSGGVGEYPAHTASTIQSAFRGIGEGV